MVKHNVIHPYSGTPFINNKALINVTIRAAKKNMQRKKCKYQTQKTVYIISRKRQIKSKLVVTWGQD